MGEYGSIIRRVTHDVMLQGKAVICLAALVVGWRNHVIGEDKMVCFEASIPPPVLVEE